MMPLYGGVGLPYPEVPVARSGCVGGEAFIPACQSVPHYKGLRRAAQFVPEERHPSPPPTSLPPSLTRRPSPLRGKSDFNRVQEYVRMSCSVYEIKTTQAAELRL
ncbi:unnamed protein product [Boreogadus saida]